MRYNLYHIEKILGDTKYNQYVVKFQSNYQDE